MVCDNKLGRGHKERKKLIRTTTIPVSMRVLLKNQLNFMSRYYDVVGITSGGKDYYKMLEEQGIRGYIVPFTRKAFSPISDIIAFIKLLIIFSKEKPYIVHSHTSKDGLLCMLAAFICRVPHRIYTIAGLADMRGVRGRLLDLAEIVTFKLATNIWPNSFKMKDIYVKRYPFIDKKTKVILNGSSNGIDSDYYDTDKICDAEKDRLKSDLAISSIDFVFIFIGRIVSDKGVNELIAAFKQVCKKGNVKLLILGNYEEELDELLAETKQEISSNECIKYVGYQQDIRPYLAISNALVLVSYREGMPNVVMQACSMKTPCIVSDINGCNEIIEEKLNGNIVPPRDIDHLKQLMNYYVDNKKEVEEMGERARKFVMDKYNYRKLWESILQEYSML